MVRRDEIERLINMKLNHVLLVAEASLPQSQFMAFRKLTLDLFGKNGLGKELDRLFNDSNRIGKDRAGIYCAKEGVYDG